MVIEKVKQLDEGHARQLLNWLQGQERGTAPARQPAGRWRCSVSLAVFDRWLARLLIGWATFALGSVSDGLGGRYLPPD